VYEVSTREVSPEEVVVIDSIGVETVFMNENWFTVVTAVVKVV